MTPQKTTTCLIGGAGFIGTALRPILKRSGRAVLVIDSGEPKSVDSDPTMMRGDYGNRQFLTKALKGVDEIVLLAYASVPKTSFEDPLSDITHNLPPALTLFEVARELKLQKLVILSSGGAVYGKAQTLPIREDAPTNPISPYGITKLAIEKYSGLYHQLYGLPTVILRPGNAYGEGQRPFTGQGFIATAVASCIEKKPLLLFGRSGTIRDYIHVHDIASAIVAVLGEGELGSCYNVGTGIGTSNREIITKIDQLASGSGLKITVHTKPPRYFDVPANILDSANLTKTTGWKPAISLEEGLHRTWSWFYERQTSQNNSPPASL